MVSWLQAPSAQIGHWPSVTLEAPYPLIRSASQGRTVADRPDRLADPAPGVPAVQIPLEMQLVHVHHPDLRRSELVVQACEQFQERLPLGRVAPAEQLLALLPTRPGRPEPLVQSRPGSRPLQLGTDPRPQLLQRSAAPGQATCLGCGGEDSLNDLLGGSRGKKGAGAPGRREVMVPGPRSLYA